MGQESAGDGEDQVVIYRHRREAFKCHLCLLNTVLIVVDLTSLGSILQNDNGPAMTWVSDWWQLVRFGGTEPP